MEFLAIMTVAVFVGACWRLFSGRQKHTALLIGMVDAFRLGDGVEGERLFAELEPELKGVRDRIWAAQGLMRARAWEHALLLVDKALALKPEDRRLARMKAILHGKMVRDDAVDRLSSWLASSPRDDEALMVLARLLVRLRRNEEAIDLLLPYVKKHRKSLAPRSLLGEAFFHAKRYPEATEHLQESMKIRDLMKRQSIPMYTTGHETGYDFRVAVEGQWEEARDDMLLAQIRSGEADSKLVIFSESSEPQERGGPEERDAPEALHAVGASGHEDGGGGGRGGLDGFD